MGRPPKKSLNLPVGDKVEYVEFSVRLTNGHFESTLRCPLHDTDEKKRDHVAKWLQLIEMGLKLGVSEMAVNLDDGRAKTE